MNEKSIINTAGLSDLFGLFEENITVSDITASKALAKVSTAIVQKRIEFNMTQKEFAAYMNVSQGMVSRWEGGDYNFSIRTLADIAERLGLELSVNMSPNKSKVRLQHMDDTDIAYVTSDKSEFVGKSCKVVKYKAEPRSAKKMSECKVYHFHERLEM